MKSKFRSAVERIQWCAGEHAENRYELGLILQEVHEQGLWKVKHPSFASFLDSPEVEVGKSMGYALVGAVGAFSREAFVQMGVSKAIRVTHALKRAKSNRERAELVEAALSGMTVRQLESVAGQRRSPNLAARLQVRVEKLQQALRRAAAPHVPGCTRTGLRPDVRCSCGLDALLAEEV